MCLYKIREGEENLKNDPKKRTIYKADGTIRSDGHHVVKNWLGHYEYFFDVVFGRPTSYYVNNPVWSKRILKVGHNLIRLDDKEEHELRPTS